MPGRRPSLLVLLLAVLPGALLGGCAGRPGPAGTGAVSAGGYLSCVPYARLRSGLNLRGHAWTWWDAAAGRYGRDSRPSPGSVLVIDRTGRLRDGHVAVVSRVMSSREVRVDHANWASGRDKGTVVRDQPVVDVSADNDWSLVRVWYPPAGALGATAYPVRGFVQVRAS